MPSSVRVIPSNTRGRDFRHSVRHEFDSTIELRLGSLNLKEGGQFNNVTSGLQVTLSHHDGDHFGMVIVKFTGEVQGKNINLQNGHGYEDLLALYCG